MQTVRITITCLLVVCLVLAAHLSFAMIMTKEEGTWPDSWPKELDQYRSQAKTVEVAHGIQETVYEIPFRNREEFERAWPYILKLKSKGAPLILEKSPFTYHVSGSKAANAVMVLSPSLGYAGGPSSPQIETKAEAEELVKQGKMLRAGPPWPESIKSPTGELPQYVVFQDGKWVPFKDKERKGFVHRARVDVILVTDGKVIDLNRIALPPDTTIVDNRFAK